MGKKETLQKINDLDTQQICLHEALPQSHEDGTILWMVKKAVVHPKSL